MDGQELNQAWQIVCGKIKESNTIDASQVEAFFSRLKPQAMSNGFLMLTADNDFIRSWVATHYLPIIKETLRAIYSTDFNVLIEVDPNQAEPKSTQTVVVENTPTSTQVTKDTTPTQMVSTPSTEPRVLVKTPLSSYTFENFVIGDSNRMAYSIALAVAEMPGHDESKNPLFIYGRSGLGKTHLLRAMQNYIQENLPSLSVVYVDSEELLSEYMEASAAHDKEKESYKNFKRRYENADVLLIDDVQYFQGKKQTLDIVFQIFNKLSSKGSQIVLSADRAPKNIDIDERYQSRFNSGGTVDIQPPEVETKLGIIREYIKERQEALGNNSFEISKEIQMYIAENSGSNVRELKSAVGKVINQIVFLDLNNISLTEVKQLLENHFSSGVATRITVTDVQRAVEKFYKVSHADLVGTKRSKYIANARQVAMYLCRQMIDISNSAVGKAFNKDHTTVMHSESIVEERMKENRELSEEIEILRRTILES